MLLWLVLPLLPITVVAPEVFSVLKQPARATVGLAEWEIITPGGDRISYLDPLKEQHGVSLRSGTTDSLIYIDQIQWWQYYPGLVVGSARRGVFLFDEATSRVTYFKSEAQLKTELNRRQLKTPLSQRYRPQDGWNEVWLPIFQARCQEFMANPPPQAELSESIREEIRQYCDQR